MRWILLTLVTVLFLSGCSIPYYYIGEGWTCRRAKLPDGRIVIICDEETAVVQHHDEYECYKITNGEET